MATKNNPKKKTDSKPVEKMAKETTEKKGKVKADLSKESKKVRKDNKGKTKKEKVIKEKDSLDKASIKKITKLKRYLSQIRISQKELSKKIEISTNTMNRMIKFGKASKPIKRLVREALNISEDKLNELLTFEEPII